MARVRLNGVKLHGLLHERLFTRLLTVRVVGQLNDGIIQSALGGYALFSPERQSTTVAVVGAFALLLLPYSVIGPFMGVFLDRWRRRQVLLFTNIIRAALVALLSWQALSGDLGPGLILTVLIVLALNRLILTALAASLPNTVDQERLIPANAVAPVAGTTAAAIGAAVTVSITAKLDATSTVTAVILSVAAVGLLITAALSLRLPVAALGPPPDHERETFRVVLANLVAGARQLLRARPAARSVAGVMLHRAAYGVALLIVIVFSRSVLSPGSASGALGVFALAIGGAGIGALVGAVLTPPVVARIGERRWCVVVMAVATVTIPLGLLTVSVAGAVAGGFFLGLAGQAAKVCTDTTIAREIPDSGRGRVFSLFDVAINVALLLGIAFAGFTVPTDGISVVLDLVCGALLAAATWFFLRSGPREPATAGSV